MTEYRPPYRSAVADYLTIVTAAFTVFSGAYSLWSGATVDPVTDTAAGYWDAPLRHALAIALTVMGLFFFMDQSVKLARRIVMSEGNVLPRWLVFGLFYFGGMAMYAVFQIILQANLFAEVQISYFITSLVIWLALAIPLGVMSVIKPFRRR
ncbi:MAG: hypothetical protein CSH36_11280 [Thalassolituus sp.]|nr:MAG: hypothetical protein CSH36_11280 [Thalassolituus sp.]